MNLIQKWLIGLIGSKIGLKDDKEGTVNTKEWYKSKTILAAVAGVVLSVYQIVSVLLAPIFGWALPPIPTWLIDALGVILGPIVIYGRSTAETKIG